MEANGKNRTGSMESDEGASLLLLICELMHERLAKVVKEIDEVDGSRRSRKREPELKKGHQENITNLISAQIKCPKMREIKKGRRDGGSTIVTNTIYWQPEFFECRKMLE